MSVQFATLSKMRVALDITTIVGRLITASGVKPIGEWQWLFKACWLYGAVEPTTGESLFRQFSHVDIQCYQRFLDEFSKTYPDSR